MTLAVDVVKPHKKKARTQAFDSEALAKSIQAACLSVRTPEGEAESTASHVTRLATLWITTKPAVTTGDIRRVVARHLERYQPDAAYYYLHQRRIL